MKAFNKTITIIVPTYNRAWSLPRAVDSLLRQTSGDWQLVVVDDGSTDTTREVVSRYLHDSRIRYFYKENGGVGSARNFGVNHAETEHVTFLDSDDEFHIFAIEQMQQDMPLFQEYNANIILYDISTAEKHALPSKAGDAIQFINYEQSIMGYWPKNDTLQLLKKDIFTSTRFPEKPGGLESIFWLSALKNGASALYRNISLGIYHTEHNTRLTGSAYVIARSKTLPLLYNDFFSLFEADFACLNPKRLGIYYLENGIFKLIAGDKRGGRISVKKAGRFNKGKKVVVLGVLLCSYLPLKIFRVLVRLAFSAKHIITK